MGLLFLYGFLTILLSFLCSILEAVLLSVNHTFIKIKIKDGLKYAEDLQKLKNTIDEPLVIILTLNTIAHTVGAIMVGVQAKITYATLNVNNSYSFFSLNITEETNPDNQEDLIGKLNELKELHEKKILNDEEFAAAKKKILGE